MHKDDFSLSSTSREREGGGGGGGEDEEDEEGGRARRDQYGLNRLHPKPTAGLAGKVTPSTACPPPSHPQVETKGEIYGGCWCVDRARSVRVARQPFALSSTTVLMDRARLRPYPPPLPPPQTPSVATITAIGTLPPRGSSSRRWL